MVRTGEGRVVWDNDSYGDAPSTVNPSLWRQSRLNAIQSLFGVVPGIYQVRGLDPSNVSFIEGSRGVVVLDPLISAETAAAALQPGTGQALPRSAAGPVRLPARNKLDRALESARSAHPTMPVTTIVVDDDPVAFLAALSARAGLLVLGRSRHPGWRGSPVDALVRHAACPVLVVPSSRRASTAPRYALATSAGR